MKIAAVNRYQELIATRRCAVWQDRAYKRWPQVPQDEPPSARAIVSRKEKDDLATAVF